MFKFFKKRQEQRQAAEAKARTFKQVLAQLESGNGNALEAALVLHLVESNQEALSRFLMTFGGSEVWILNKTGERLGDPAVTEGSDGNPYLAVFTSHERAAAAAVEWELSNRSTVVTALELVFTLGASAGMVLNANDPHLQWSFTPEHVANLRTLFERSYNYEVGGIYSIWSQGTYKAAKLLSVDEGGLHLRVYANTFPERHAKIDPAALTLDSGDTGSMRAVGHMPVVRSSFLAMGPKLMTSIPVTDAELEGYRIWVEAKGGYFGA